MNIYIESVKNVYMVSWEIINELASRILLMTLLFTDLISVYKYLCLILASTLCQIYHSGESSFIRCMPC